MSKDEPYLMTSWWRHHGGHGSLISCENSPFLACKGDNLIVSHPIFTKLDMNDVIGSGANPIWWRNDDVITDVIVHFGLKHIIIMFTSIFDHFKVEIGQIQQHTSQKTIISAFQFHRAWPHVEIPTRTEVTAQNVSPSYFFYYSFLASFLSLLSVVSSSFYRM